MCTKRVGLNFVEETEMCFSCQHSAFRTCTKGLVILTPRGAVAEELIIRKVAISISHLRDVTCRIASRLD